jgi:predicted MPP superfamily phosphohydrolase
MKRRKMIVWILLGIFCLMCLLDALVIEPWAAPAQIREELLIEDLPLAFEGMRVVFVSDLHADTPYKRKKLRQRVEQINGLQADLILLGGDYCDDSHREVFEILGNLQAQLGVYAVNGNHDYRGRGESNAAMEKNGILCCDNTSFSIEREGEKLIIAGIGDLQAGFSDPGQALEGIREEDAVILLCHEPQSVSQAAQLGLGGRIDVALCGHTHGGQATIFGLWGPLTERDFPTYTSQWVSRGGVRTLESNGAGQQWNIRFFARPQLHVLTLRRG